MDYEILLVDDLPIIVDGYINLISETDFQKRKPNFIKSYNCEDAYNKIFLNLERDVNINLALLDINLPPYKDFNINSGIDLALLIREKFTDCKIIIITMYSEPITVDSIIKKIKPEGFLSKNDITSESFRFILKKIIDGSIYQSKGIMESQKEIFKKNINWDIYDNEILILISQGVKTVNLPNYIPLSMSAIEKRKANIKDQLLERKGSDKDLISKAKKNGLL
ncbi:response regulator [Flavobacterium marginilacus]|uniref:response regulator n=1 Tax=Flavobacterium marginilacus TaxID=3003256 RepID=UPI00248E7F43|nr:response regulator [Flavobacterium marginilacus]